jgi:hypothetical protein
LGLSDGFSRVLINERLFKFVCATTRKIHNFYPVQRLNLFLPKYFFPSQRRLSDGTTAAIYTRLAPRPVLIDRFHLTSRRPYWCTKTMKWRPYWCTVRELALSFSNISYCFTTPLGPPITWVKTIYTLLHGALPTSRVLNSISIENDKLWRNSY